MLKIVLKRSYIGLPVKQQKVLEALGLRKIGSSVRRADDKSTHGIIRMVSHLVTVEKVDE
ncbi:MAG: 50S ribosomal protein L30 [Nitrospirota bacterium]